MTSIVKQCVVVKCEHEAVVVAGKPTPWGAWEYWVCKSHKTQIKAGATINDNSDGRSITLTD